MCRSCRCRCCSGRWCSSVACVWSISRWWGRWLAERPTPSSWSIWRWVHWLSSATWSQVTPWATTQWELRRIPRHHGFIWGLTICFSSLGVWLVGCQQWCFVSLTVCFALQAAWDTSTCTTTVRATRLCSASSSPLSAKPASSSSTRWELHFPI